MTKSPALYPPGLPETFSVLSSAWHPGSCLKQQRTSKLYYKPETTVRTAIFVDTLVAVVLAGKEVEIKLILEIVAERQ